MPLIAGPINSEARNKSGSLVDDHRVRHTIGFISFKVKRGSGVLNCVYAFDGFIKSTFL